MIGTPQGSAADVAEQSVKVAIDVRKHAVGWWDGVYLGGEIAAGQGSDCFTAAF